MIIAVHERPILCQLKGRKNDISSKLPPFVMYSSQQWTEVYLLESQENRSEINTLYLIIITIIKILLSTLVVGIGGMVVGVESSRQ